jgi:predicted nucleic acid-binding protein
MRIWVVDTSPLIFLAKLNRLDLLKKAGRVLVPMAVLREIQEYPDEAAATQKARLRFSLILDICVHNC